jgi:receptor expression-enhancing protein 1/2/3/4
MFGFIADILTSITSILFPIYASYKAIRTGDPTDLAPWLMYWVTLSLFLLVESHLYFILYWVPFYSWMRLGLHLYLVMPGKQGSVYIYQAYVHPWLESHERQIDELIHQVHAKGKAAGFDAVQAAIEYIRVNFLGQAPHQPPPPQAQGLSYSASLLSRFNMPAARSTVASAGSTDIFSMLGKMVQQSTYPTSTTREAKAEDLVQTGSLIPPSLSGNERTDFVNTQRDRLQTLLQAFDREAGSDSSYSSAMPPPPTHRNVSGRKSYLSTNEGEHQDYPMHKSRSDSEFEDLAYEPMPDPDAFRPPPPPPNLSNSRRSSREGGSGGGWSNMIWGNYGQKDSAINPRKDM